MGQHWIGLGPLIEAAVLCIDRVSRASPWVFDENSVDAHGVFMGARGWAFANETPMSIQVKLP